MTIEILTVPEAAVRLKIPASTVTTMCRRGELLGARKAGRSWRIPESAIGAFFAAPAAPSARASGDVPLEEPQRRGPSKLVRLLTAKGGR